MALQGLTTEGFGRGRKFLRVVLIIGITITVSLAANLGAAMATTRVSVDSGGIEGDRDSTGPSMSANGRFVAFWSGSTNLVQGDINNEADVFVHDRQTGATTRVSVDSAGGEGNQGSLRPSISSDGRFVAFESSASNLVQGDANNVMDVFVHDRQTGATTRVSVDSGGGEGNDDSQKPSISSDGRFVAFESYASNLVPGDNNSQVDIFVHDRQTGATTRVSVDSGGGEGNASSQGPSISADGRFVAFDSVATNLVPGDTNAFPDVFVHDLQTGATTRVSVDSGGTEGTLGSSHPAISSNGRFVAFYSAADNLVPGDNNNDLDIFVHDLQTGETTRVSVDSAGGEGNSTCYSPSISSDGRFVVFRSWADNLVAGDNNIAMDIFAHDRLTGETIRVSVDSNGVEGNNHSVNDPAISSDGHVVAFESYADNLVLGDNNGKDDVFVYAPLFLPQPSGQAVSAPTMNQWGMILFMVVAGAASAYTLRRKNA